MLISSQLYHLLDCPLRCAGSAGIAEQQKAEKQGRDDSIK